MKNKKNFSRWATLIFYPVIGLAGVFALNYSMAIQPWGGSDTAVYFNMAQNIAAGHGFVTNYPSGNLSFVGLHPPFFSIVLSLFVKYQISLITAVKILNSIFFAMILIITGLWIQGKTHSWVCGFLVSFTLLFQPAFLQTFTAAMSEPLYLFLAIASLILLIEGLLRSNGSVGWLVVSAVLAGLASFTRFIGVSSILLGCVAILLFLSVRPVKKWLLALLYGIVAGAPLLFWFLQKSLIFPTNTSRTIVFPADFYHACARFFYGVVDTVISWMPPAMLMEDTRLRRWVTLAIVVLLLVVWWWLNHQHYRKLFHQHDPRILLVLVMLLLVVFYLVVFFVSYVFSSIPPDIYARTLIMLIPCLVIALFSVLQISFYGFGQKKSFITLAVFLIFTVGFLPAYSVQSITFMKDQHQIEDGYLQPKYVHSELLQVIHQLPAQSLISNQAAVVLLYTGKYPYEFREFECEKVKGRSDIPFGAGTSQDDQRYRSGMLLVVFQDDINRIFYNCFSNNASEYIQTFFSYSRAIATTSDGYVYQYDPKGEEK